MAEWICFMYSKENNSYWNYLLNLYKIDNNIMKLKKSCAILGNTCNLILLKFSL